MMGRWIYFHTYMGSLQTLINTQAIIYSLLSNTNSFVFRLAQMVYSHLDTENYLISFT